MIYPFFSLSKRKRTKPIKYETDKVYIEVAGIEGVGIATIYDADILIYVCSQLMEALNRGLPTSRTFQISMYDILQFIGKATGGQNYAELKAALDRLQATSILTNIRNDKFSKRERFNWITSWKAVEDTKTGRPVAIEFELCKWLYEGIIEKRLVLKIHQGYFGLQSGYQRFLYNVARKMCGQKTTFRINMRKLYEISGSTDNFSHFRRGVVRAIDKSNIPGYAFQLTERQEKKKVYMLYIANKDNDLEALTQRLENTETLAQSI